MDFNLARTWRLEVESAFLQAIRGWVSRRQAPCILEERAKRRVSKDEEATLGR